MATTTTVEPEAPTQGTTTTTTTKGAPPSKGPAAAVPNVEQGEKLPPTEHMAKTTKDPSPSKASKTYPKGGYVRIEGGGLWLVVLALAALALAGGSVVVSVVLHL